eukprot:141025-Amorphochlora_amoeboformis.AAC.2
MHGDIRTISILLSNVFARMQLSDKHECYEDDDTDFDRDDEHTDSDDDVYGHEEDEDMRV